MSAYDILSDLTPHGTVAGFDAGCRTNHCPAPIACHVFRTRYVGEFGFRKRVDAGWTAAELAAWDAEQTAAAHEAERAARRAERDARRARTPKLRPVANGSTGVSGRTVTRVLWSDDHVATLQRLVSQGKSDQEVADALGRTRQSVFEKRRALRIASQAVVVWEHGTLTGYSRHKCKGDDCPATPSCGEVGRSYYRGQWEKRQERKPDVSPGAKTRTHCKRGHELTPENTLWRDGGTRRNCLPCAAEANREQRAARAAGVTLAEYRARKEQAA